MGRRRERRQGKDWRKWVIKTCFTIIPLKGQRDKGGRKKGGREKEGKGGRKIFMLCSSLAGLLESDTDHEQGVPAAAAVSQTKFM